MKPLQIGMCSWSLKAPTFAEALEVCKEQIGLNLIQLGFFNDQQLADQQATIDDGPGQRHRGLGHLRGLPRRELQDDRDHRPDRRLRAR